MCFSRRAARRCGAKLVPLAEQVNDVAVRGVSAADVAATRRTLLVMIENLARDELQAGKKRRRMPSTRELARRVAAASALTRAQARHKAAHRGP